MGYTVTLVLSYSIIPALIAGLVRFRYLKSRYWPIIASFALGSLNEVVSTLVISQGHSNALNNNIFYLFEALLLPIQFGKWGLFNSRRTLPLLLALFVVGWVWESTQLDIVSSFLCWFRIGSAAAFIFMSIVYVLKLIGGCSNPLLKEPGFVFCFGFCLYYLCILLTEFFLYDAAAYSLAFRDLLFRTLSFCNVIANFIYLTALLWVPRKPIYTTTYC
ncbi:MAG: hypothetical protein EOO06_05410 [Chitinophagaceae bacterium]|nr:MAG: hypothetical protein EOO06_05410 [Chitinophagaceae bacterium]